MHERVGVCVTVLGPRYVIANAWEVTSTLWLAVGNQSALRAALPLPCYRLPVLLCTWPDPTPTNARTCTGAQHTCQARRLELRLKLRAAELQQVQHQREGDLRAQEANGMCS